jgi:hypothetical protein
MNMPNFAVCHQAILCARVASCARGIADGCAFAVCAIELLSANASAACAEHATPPLTAPIRFKNDLLDNSSLFISLQMNRYCQRVCFS